MPIVRLNFDPSQEQDQQGAGILLPAGKYLLNIARTDFVENNGYPAFLVYSRVAGATDGAAIGKNTGAIRVQIPNETDEQTYARVLKIHGDEDKAKKSQTALRIQREQIKALLTATGHPLSQDIDTDLIKGLVCADVGVEKSKDPQYPDKNTGRRWSLASEYVGNTEPSKVGASSRNVVRPLPNAKNAQAPVAAPAIPSVEEIEADFDIDDEIPF